VASVAVPMSYGMTPGESALWINKALKLGVDLTVGKDEGLPPRAGALSRLAAVDTAVARHRLLGSGHVLSGDGLF